MVIALTPGICSDQEVFVGVPYLGRIDKRYFVLTPICPEGTTRPNFLFRDAYFIDPMTKQLTSFRELDEAAQIF